MPIYSEPVSDDALIRLTNLRALKLTPQELSSRVGSRYTYWRDLLLGKKSFGEKVARKIEAALGLPRYGLDESGAVLKVAPPSEAPQMDGDAGGDIVIPQYEAGGSMGFGRLLLENEPPGHIKQWTVDNDWLRRNVPNHTGAQNLCIVTGFGPSMRPMFNPGDPLLVDTGVKTCEEDAVFFFRWRSHGFIKMLQRIPTADGLVIRAKSKNPDYDAFDIKVDSDFQVLAKVLTVWKSEQF